MKCWIPSIRYDYLAMPFLFAPSPKLDSISGLLSLRTLKAALRFFCQPLNGGVQLRVHSLSFKQHQLVCKDQLPFPSMPQLLKISCWESPNASWQKKKAALWLRLREVERISGCEMQDESLKFESTMKAGRIRRRDPFTWPIQGYSTYVLCIYIYVYIYIYMHACLHTYIHRDIDT